MKNYFSPSETQCQKQNQDCVCLRWGKEPYTKGNLTSEFYFFNTLTKFICAMVRFLKPLQVLIPCISIVLSEMKPGLNSQVLHYNFMKILPVT